MLVWSDFHKFAQFLILILIDFEKLFCEVSQVVYKFQKLVFSDTVSTFTVVLFSRQKTFKKNTKKNFMQF